MDSRVAGIFSREEMESFLKKHNSLNGMVVISITDPGYRSIPAELLARADDFLVVKFWDIERECGMYKPISRQTAKKIAGFIWKNRDKRFLINCEAGVSRSAGVGMAVDCILRDKGSKYRFSLNGSWIASSPRFSPNWFVFDRIVEEFFGLEEVHLDDDHMWIEGNSGAGVP